MNVETVTAAWKEAQRVAPSAWRDLRERGLHRFAEVGIPTPRHEDWKFTSLAALKSFDARPSPAEPPAVVPSIGGVRVVLVDGVLSTALSDLDEGDPHVRISSLAALSGDADVNAIIGAVALDGDDAFTALNSAFLADGVAIQIRGGHAAARPVHIVHISTHAGGSSHARVQIVADDGASVDVVEQFVGVDHPYLQNPVTEAIVGVGARVGHVRIVHDGVGAFHVGRLAVRQGRDSQFVSRHFAVGGRIARCRVDVTLGHGASVDLSGLYLAGEGQLIDFHTTVDHAHPHGVTREVFRGVVDRGGRGVFTGRVIVRQDAQRTDAAQSVKNLLLDDDAVANARPQLEIFADDVKCSHGAAIGRLDDEALFYLRSRGIGLTEARRVLTYAFANEQLAGVDHEATRLLIEGLVHAWLARMGPT